jgi:hypothetical protein
MFLSGISSSIVEFPKANGIFFMFTVMFMPTLSPVLKSYTDKQYKICCKGSSNLRFRSTTQPQIRNAGYGSADLASARFLILLFL